MSELYPTVGYFYFCYFIPQGFLEAFDMFNSIMADFDRRLATITCQAFFDCSGLEAEYKVSMNFKKLSQVVRESPCIWIADGVSVYCKYSSYSLRLLYFVMYLRKPRLDSEGENTS